MTLSDHLDLLSSFGWNFWHSEPTLILLTFLFVYSFSYYELLDGRDQDMIHSVPHRALLATGSKYMLKLLEEYGVGEGVEITEV